MLAVPERVAPRTADQPEEVVWHKPIGRPVEEFQAIACSGEEGITFPPPKQNIPLRLNKPGERWCEPCLALTRAPRRRTNQEVLTWR
jgi:hypothetical protein